MRYRSINVLEKFDFKDTLVHKLQIAENTLTADLEAVIVQPDNSQNSNFTKSYAGDLVMTLQGAKLQKAIKEGYKYYDANDVLKEVVPDTVLEDEEIKQLLARLEKENKGLKHRIFGAMQRADIDGYGMEKTARRLPIISEKKE